MKNADLRKFDIDGVAMVFNRNNFNKAFESYCKTNSCRYGEGYIRLSEELHCSDSTVKSWRFDSGPSDLELIKRLAVLFGLSDYSYLLKKAGEVTMETKYTDRQLDALKTMYGAIISFLFEFEETNGFNDLWFKFVDEGIKNPEADILDYADNKIRELTKALEMQYFDLRGLEVYDKLYEFINSTLVDTYDGKCSYGYRFEAQGENADGTRDTRTTDEDYLIASNALDELFEQYVWC